MNYHKKLISIGFKRIPSIIVVEEDKWPYNEVIIKASEYDEEEHKRLRFPYTPLSKTLCYKYNDIYIIVDRADFCLLTEKRFAGFDDISKKYIRFKSKLSDSFWKEILEHLPSDIKREILIKNIIK